MTLYDVLGNNILDVDLGTSITGDDQAYEFKIPTALDLEVTSAEGYQRMSDIQICVQGSFNDDIRLRPEIELVLWGVHYDISEFDKSMVRIKGCKYLHNRMQVEPSNSTIIYHAGSTTDFTSHLFANHASPV
jgi:hypothetical protein